MARQTGKQMTKRGTATSRGHKSRFNHTSMNGGFFHPNLSPSAKSGLFIDARNPTITLLESDVPSKNTFRAILVQSIRIVSRGTKVNC